MFPGSQQPLFVPQMLPAHNQAAALLGVGAQICSAFDSGYRICRPFDSVLQLKHMTENAAPMFIHLRAVWWDFYARGLAANGFPAEARPF
ncbi:hypothetical protein ANO11243_078830 [Dothideomycetidae sp. 11243]|nr:hypothetical protein ANO11243_078830 [fungal sp. No.11243]